jgi:hypothetical protein
VGLLVALVLTVPAWLPWLDPRQNLWEVDDAKNHLLRLYVLEWMIVRGDWYPRWFPDMFIGFGYPVLNFYAPVFYYLALFLKALLRLDFWDAFRVSGVVAALIATTGTYALTWTLWRRASLAILAALTLLYGPYAFQINLYRRGDIPEAIGLALLPWLLLSIWRLWFAPSSGTRLVWALGVTATAASVILVHNITALIAAVLGALWTLFLLVVWPDRRALLYAVMAAVVAAGLSAFFWLPALAESKLVQLELAVSGNVDYRHWLIDPAGNTAKIQSVDNRQTRTGLIDLNLHYPHLLVAPPKISLAQAGLGLVALMSGLVLAGSSLRRLVRRWTGPPSAQPMRTRPEKADDSPNTGDTEQAAGWAGVFLLLFAIACWLLTFAPSAPVWEHLPGLRLVQFPWRLLGPLGVCIAIAGAGAFAPLLSWLERRWGELGATLGVCAVTLVAAAVLVNSLGDRVFQLGDSPPRTIDGRSLLEDERFDPIAAGTTSGREFMPREVDIPDHFYGEKRMVRTVNLLFPEGEWIGGMFRPVTGEMRLLNWQGGNLWLSARVVNDGSQPALMGIHQVRFAGWEARVDGKRIEPEIAPYVPEADASLSFMVIPIPPGEHTLTLSFGLTPARSVAVAITLASALAAAGGLAAYARRRRQTVPAAHVRLAGAVIFTLLVVAALAVRGLAPLFQTVSELPVPRAVGGIWQGAGLTGNNDGLLVNIAEAARTGQARIASPSGDVPGPDRFVDVRYLRVTDLDGLRNRRGQTATTSRQWLYMHPTSTVTLDVSLPPGRRALFQSALALDPVTVEQPVGDGVRFQASVARIGTSGRVEEPALVLDRDLNPRANHEERRWVPVEVDLSAWSGSTVRLTLRTLPRQDASYDWAGWGDPVVIVRETARTAIAHP